MKNPIYLQLSEIMLLLMAVSNKPNMTLNFQLLALSWRTILYAHACLCSLLISLCVIYKHIFKIIGALRTRVEFKILFTRMLFKIVAVVFA